MSFGKMRSSHILISRGRTQATQETQGQSKDRKMVVPEAEICTGLRLGFVPRAVEG
jgi:hypothetical protein